MSHLQFITKQLITKRITISFLFLAIALLPYPSELRSAGPPPVQFTNLSNSKITAGLKEALTVCTGKAVSLTGRPDGFLKNAAIKILLPDKLRTAGKTMRMMGMGQQ